MGLELKVRSVLWDLDDVYEYTQVGHKKTAEWRTEKCVS